MLCFTFLVPEDDRCRDKLDTSLVPPQFVRQFTCSGTYQCLYERQVLDEFADCPDKSDEREYYMTPTCRTSKIELEYRL